MTNYDLYIEYIKKKIKDILGVDVILHIDRDIYRFTANGKLFNFHIQQTERRFYICEASLNGGCLPREMHTDLVLTKKFKSKIRITRLIKKFRDRELEILLT